MVNRRFISRKGILVGLFLRIAMVLMTVMMVEGTVIKVFAMGNGSIMSGQDEQVVVKEATLEDEFTSDIILVTLTQEVTLRFKDYSVVDFPELKLERITEMTESLASRTEAQIRNDANGIVEPSNIKRIDVEKFRRILQLELAEPSKEAILEAISILEKRDDVRSAEPNYIGEFSTITTNDPHLGDQWALNYLQLPDAWHISTGAATVRVGIADSGIDRNHPDLMGRINEGLSRDHTGDGNPWIAGNVHGTHVAGIVGAFGNNSVGVVGTNWNVELVSLKVGNLGPTSALLSQHYFMPKQMTFE